MIDEGLDDKGGWEDKIIPSLLTMWELASESAYHSLNPGGVSDTVLKLLVRDDVSKESPCIGFQTYCCCCGGAT
jgi:hypothetical protein